MRTLLLIRASLLVLFAFPLIHICRAWRDLFEVYKALQIFSPSWGPWVPRFTNLEAYALMLALLVPNLILALRTRPDGQPARRFTCTERITREVLALEYTVFGLLVILMLAALVKAGGKFDYYRFAQG